MPIMPINNNKDKYTFRINGKDIYFGMAQKIVITKEVNYIDSMEVTLFPESQKIELDDYSRIYFIHENKKYLLLDVEDLENKINGK